ncbi:Uncharacterised protein [Xylophilus ampelinus]|nr:Uncharacterised protein [Xylophilus ampelinus]
MIASIAQFEALRQQSQARFAAAWSEQEARAARGLVSESTSGFALKRSVPTAVAWAERCITIDRAQARITRLRKAVGIGSKCLLNLSHTPAENNVMVTLTYRGTNADWRPRHISDYIRHVRAWFKERCPGEKLRYVWVGELQDGKRREDGEGRGVIHYHAIFFLPAGVSMPQADRKGWWPHGFTNTEKGRAPVAYLMSYAKKADSKNVRGFPRGARIHGVGGLCAVGAAIKRWALWPAYVQGNASINDPFKPAKGGGYLNAQTGEFVQSEWAPTGGGYSSFTRVRVQPRAIEAAGPFSWVRPHGVTVH